MNKFWRVASYEFLSNLKKPSFLFTAFGVPVLVMVIWAVVFTLVVDDGALEDVGDIGIVDTAGILSAEVSPTDYFPQGIIPYATTEEAQAQLDEGVIGIYVVVPQDYLMRGKVQVYRYGSVPPVFRDALEDYLAQNVSWQVAGKSIAPQRLNDPAEVTTIVQDTGRVMNESALILLILTPMVFVIVFMMATQLSAGYLMSSIVEEKSNRIIELFITSVTPMQLLAGKVIGLGALGLVQLGAWLCVAIVALALSDRLPFLADLYIPTDLLVLSVVYFILSYLLSSAIMAAIGVIVGTEEESRQYASVLSLVTILPFFFIVQFFENPNGTIPVILTLFPMTSGITSILRLGYGGLPMEQMVASLLILTLTTLLVIWASAKIFRWGTLMYGKKPNLREIVQIIRSARPVTPVVQTVKES